MTKLTDQDRDLLGCANFTEILVMELQFRCLRNSFYSLRAFARDLNMTPSALSTISRSIKKPSPIMIAKIANGLQRPAPVCDYFKHLAMAQTGASQFVPAEEMAKARAIRLQFLYSSTKANHRTIDQWDLPTFALALLLKVKGELRTDEALSQRLGVTVERLQEIIESLEKVGWLERTEQGLVSNLKYEELGNQGSAYHIRSIHRRTLNQAIASLENLPTESRYYYSAFFTMSPSQFEQVCEKMRAFALSTGEVETPAAEPQEVYALGTFLLPLTSKSTIKI